MKAGVVGVGHHGRHHVRILSELENVELVGVVDSNPETAQAIAAEFSTKVFPNIEALSAEIDAVSIVVPAVDHFKVAKHFIEKGIHIFMEKPITESSEQAEKLVQLVHESGIFFQSGHIERFNPAIQALSSLLTKPLFIETHRLCKYNPRGCDVGVVMDLMIHDLDIVLHLVNDGIKSISSVGVNVLSPTEDIANARIEFEHGCIANITVSRVSADNLRKIRIFQHDAYISLDYRNQEGVIYRKEGDEIVMEPVPTVKSEPLKLQLQSFADCVTNGTPPEVPVEDGKRVVDVATAITRDIEARKKVQWAAT